MPTISLDESIPTLAERRRRASRELMRGEILAAAQNIIRTQGMDALSLRALAKAVGVTAPALYEYFSSKEAILRALFVEGSHVMLARMEQTISGLHRRVIGLTLRSGCSRAIIHGRAGMTQMR